MPEARRVILARDTGRAASAAAALDARIRPILQAVMPASADIRHIGATAVPGCLTKGDLDLVVRVAASDFTAAEAILAARFARNAGSIRTDDFAAFSDDAQAIPLGIPLTAKDGRFDVFHLFAEALGTDAALLARYNALKMRHDGSSMDMYRAEKAAFIEVALNRHRSGPG